MQKLNNTKNKTFDIIIISFFIFLPIVFLKNIIDPVLIPRQLLLSVFVLLCVLILIYQSSTNKFQTDFRFIKLILPQLLLLFLIFQIISISKAINLAESFYFISKTSIFFTFYIVISTLLISKRIDINILIKSIIIFISIIVLFAFYQIADLLLNNNDFWSNIKEITSTSTNKNFLSSIIFLSIPFLINSFRLRKNYRIISFVVLILGLLLIILLQTRAVWFALISSSIVICITLLISIRYKTIESFKQHKNIIGIICITVISVLSIFIYKWQTKDSNSIEQKSNAFSYATNERTYISRILLWENSIKMIKDMPVLGVGAGNWQIMIPKYGLSGFSKGVQNSKMSFQRPHNDYLWVFAETGIFGFITYILIFIISLLYLFRLYLKSSIAEDKFMYISLIFGISGYLIISFFDFPLERIEHQVIISTILSIITFKYYETKIKTIKTDGSNKIPIKTRMTTLKNNKLSTFLLIPLIIFSIIVCSYRYKGLQNTKIIYDDFYKGNWNKIIDEVNQTVNMFYNIDPVSTPIYWYEGVAYSSLNDFDKARISFEKGYKIHPNNILILNNLASCYEKSGNIKLAIKYYTAAITIAPKFEEAILNLSATYYNLMDYENAYLTIDKLKTNTESKNYLKFLNPILQEKMKLIIFGQKDKNIADKLKELFKDSNNLIIYYKRAKDKKIDFEKYIKSISNSN